MFKTGKELLFWTITGSVSLGVAVAVPTFSILHFNRNNNYNPEQLWYVNDLVDENNSQLYFHSKQEINFYVNKYASLDSASTFQYNNFQVDRDLNKIVVYANEEDLKKDIFEDARKASSTLLSSHKKVAEGIVSEGQPTKFYPYNSNGSKEIYKTSFFDVATNSFLYTDDKTKAIDSFLQNVSDRHFAIQPASFLNSLVEKYTGGDYSSVFANATHARIGRTDGNALIKYWENIADYYNDAIDILLNSKQTNNGNRFTFAVNKELEEFAPQEVNPNLTDNTYSIITTRGAREDYKFFSKNSINKAGFYDVNKIKSIANGLTIEEKFKNNNCAPAYAPSELQPLTIGGHAPALYIANLGGTNSGHDITSNIFDAKVKQNSTTSITYGGISKEERKELFKDANNHPTNTMVFANRAEFQKFLQNDKYISPVMRGGTWLKKTAVLDPNNSTLYMANDLSSDASVNLARQYAEQNNALTFKRVNFNVPDEGKWDDLNLTASTDVYELNGNAYKTEEEFLEAYYQFEKNRPNSPIVYETREFFRIGNIKAIGSREDLLKIIDNDVLTINTKDLSKASSFHIYKPGD